MLLLLTDLLFDPDINLFLQSFAHVALTWFMFVVSALGSNVFFTLAAGFILFRIDFPKGLFIVQMFLWAVLLNDFLKELLDLPRPTDVFRGVLSFEEFYPAWLMQIFPLGKNPGFPSGHVCSTTVFWGGVIMMFPGRVQKAAAVFFIATMPLSRMYLGRHFLGDVLGGFFLGIMIVATGYCLLFSSRDRKLRNPIRFLALMVLPLILLFIRFFDPKHVGEIFGVNLASFFLMKKGLSNRVEPAAGWTRFVLAAALYTGMKFIYFFGLFDLQNFRLDFLDGFAPAFIAIWGTIEISSRLELREVP